MDNRVTNTIVQWNGMYYFGTDKGMDAVDLKGKHRVTNELTDRILPDLKRMQKHFDMVMAHPLRAKIIFRTLPRAYTVNLIAGWIAYDSAREHLGNYNEWIMQK